MKCPSCRKENIDGAKFCKFCGKPLEENLGAGSQKQRTIEYKDTISKKSSRDTIPLKSRNDKTIIDSSPPRLKPQHTERKVSDKTVIIPSGSKTSTDSPSNLRRGIDRKIVGWLISYDLNPNGTDYRLYEGRMKIGRSNKNDIVISEASISEDHALILYRDEKFLIDDKLSSNGTFINGNLISDKTVLQDRDEIKFGDVKFSIVMAKVYKK